MGEESKVESLLALAEQDFAVVEELSTQAAQKNHKPNFMNKTANHTPQTTPVKVEIMNEREGIRYKDCGEG